jgi:hypothetical protein
MNVVAELIKLGVDCIFPYTMSKESWRNFANSHTKEVSDRMDQFILNNQTTLEDQASLSLTPYDIACVMGHEETIKLLLPYKKVDEKPNEVLEIRSLGFFSNNLQAENSPSNSVLANEHCVQEDFSPSPF